MSTERRNFSNLIQAVCDNVLVTPSFCASDFPIFVMRSFCSPSYHFIFSSYAREFCVVWRHDKTVSIAFKESYHSKHGKDQKVIQYISLEVGGYSRHKCSIEPFIKDCIKDMPLFEHWIWIYLETGTGFILVSNWIQYVVPKQPRSALSTNWH